MIKYKKLSLINIISIILLVLAVFSFLINKYLFMGLMLAMICTYSISMFQNAKNSILKCVFYLLVSSIDSLIIVVILSEFFPKLTQAIDSMGDIQILIGAAIYTVVLFCFFLIVIICADRSVARITILIIVTAATLFFTIGSALISALPLTKLNDLIFEILDNGMDEYFSKNYDGRVVFTLFIQLFTFPIWIDSMIATVVGEIKWLNNNK